jgi:hypothetical protein
VLESSERPDLDLLDLGSEVQELKWSLVNTCQVWPVTPSLLPGLSASFHFMSLRTVTGGGGLPLTATGVVNASSPMFRCCWG